MTKFRLHKFPDRVSDWPEFSSGLTENVTGPRALPWREAKKRMQRWNPVRAPRPDYRRRCGFLHSPLPTCTCFSDKLSNSYAGFTLDLSTKIVGRNQANRWKACHIVISAHGDKLWRTQVFFSTNFAIAELHELPDLQRETNSSRIGNFHNNTWKRKYKI